MEVEDLTLELEDPLRGVETAGPVGVEHLVLHLGHVVVEPGDHRRVVVDHAVDDRVQHRHRAATDAVEVLFDLRPHVG